MKKLYLIFLLFPAFAFATNYPGNGNSGFGGTVGQGSLDITDDGTTITATLHSGNALNDVMVMYIDNLQGGGYANTSTFTDNADGGREAISGFNATNPSRSTVFFPSGFTPQYAIAEQGGFVGIFNLSNPANFTYITSGNQVVNGGDYTFTVNKSDLGIVGAPAFKFFATYISFSAFRSDEAVGAALPAGNPGFNNSISPATFAVYGNVLALNLLNFSGTEQNKSTILKWETASEQGLSRFEVQQSADAVNWKTASVLPARNQQNAADYSVAVADLPTNVNYYRLKIVDQSGNISYSRILSVFTQKTNGISLINTVAQTDIRFTVADAAGSQVTVSVYNTAGTLLSARNFANNGAFANYTLPVTSLQTGLYIVRIATQNAQASFRFFKE